jgi:halocin C8-like bacteriocin domain-containing protein
MLDMRRWRPVAAALAVSLVAPLVVAPVTASAHTDRSAEASAWARAAKERPKSTGTRAQRLEAKDLVRASKEAAGVPYAYDRAVVQVHATKAVVQAVAPGMKQATSTVFIVDLAQRTVLAARSIQFAKQASGRIAMSIADGKTTRFRGAINPQTGRLSALPSYARVLSKAGSTRAHAVGCRAAKARTAAAGHSTQVATAAGICEWAVAALCGTGGGIGCYGACIALGLVNGPGGIGCAAVCALIASLGCTEATHKICG